MKPSNARVVVIFNRTHWQDLPVDTGVPVDRRIPPRALSGLTVFAVRNVRPLLFSEQVREHGIHQRKQQSSALGPPEFQRYIAQPQASGSPLC